MSLTKPLFFLIASFICSISYSQKKIEHYYNYYGRECPVDDARYFSLEIKTDSGWYKKDYYVSIKKQIIDYRVSLPLNPAFDKAALGLFDNSPAWEPFISHNRKVYGTVSESINFSIRTTLF